VPGPRTTANTSTSARALMSNFVVWADAFFNGANVDNSRLSPDSFYKGAHISAVTWLESVGMRRDAETRCQWYETPVHFVV